MNISCEIRKVIAEVLGINSSVLSEDTTIGDLPGWDSFHHLQIISNIEQKFGFQFNADDLISFGNIKDIVNAVEKRCG